MANKIDVMSDGDCVRYGKNVKDNFYDSFPRLFIGS